MALGPIIVAISGSGEAIAERLSAALDAPLHGRADRVENADAYFGNVLEHIRSLFAAGHPVIGVCASGILIRAVAPLLADKTREPPVLSVADDGTVIVPLLGGHRGANRLARRCADILNTHAAVTTAGDVALGVSLDEPPAGWRLGTPDLAKPAMAALLSGAGATVTGKAAWLDALPMGEGVRIAATERRGPAGALTFHPQRFTLGVGCARNCPVEELADLVRDCLCAADIAPGALVGIFSLDLKADEPAIAALTAELDLPLRVFSAEALEEETPRLATPSDVVYAEVGCHGVAEAAALAAAGAQATLRLPKRKSANATCSIAETPEPILTLPGRARGRLSLIGIGPGQAEWRTPEASRLVAEAEELVGYGLYIDLLGPLAAGKPRKDFPLGGEEARCRYALERAGEGRNIALVCSGDAGIYAMGALVFELLDRCDLSDAAERVEVVSAPGISALQAAAARAGAPLGHDFCAISLSDLLTPRDVILRRVRAAAEGDFVIAFYNPVSKRRRDLLPLARDILLAHRPADTPVLLARSLGRTNEDFHFCRLEDVSEQDVDMMTVVLVGSSASRLLDHGGMTRMYTPRGYARKIDGDLRTAQS